MAAAKAEPWEPPQRRRLVEVEGTLMRAQQALVSRSRPRDALRMLRSLGQGGGATDGERDNNPSLRDGIAEGCAAAPEIAAAVGSVHLRVGELPDAIRCFETAAAHQAAQAAAHDASELQGAGDGAQRGGEEEQEEEGQGRHQQAGGGGRTEAEWLGEAAIVREVLGVKDRSNQALRAGDLDAAISGYESAVTMLGPTASSALLHANLAAAFTVGVRCARSLSR
jgi:hypothetical protein